MADAKITALAEETAVVEADLVAIVDDVAVTPVTKKATIANILKSENAYLNVADMPIEPAGDDVSVGPHTDDLDAGMTIAQWDVVCLQADGKWDKTDANTLALYSGLLGIAKEAKDDGEAMDVALPGSIIRNDGWSDWTVGAVIYLSETAGLFTHTAPTTSDSAQRIIGYALTVDTIWFDPDSTWTTHT